MNNSINFKGTFVRPATVKLSDNLNLYKNHNISMVELNPHSDNDMMALNAVAYSWDHRRTFADDIASNMADYYIENRPCCQKKFYVLTEQKQDFDDLDAMDILATAQVSKYNETVMLDFLQVDPDYTMNRAFSRYKKIGTAFINSLKAIFPDKEIILKPVESAIEFYRTNGFEEFGRMMRFCPIKK